MNKIREAEIFVLDAVDRWTRKILRDDRELSKEEQEIFDAAVKLNSIRKKDLPKMDSLNVSNVVIPPPPRMPVIGVNPSQIPTIPAGPKKTK